MFLYFFLPLTSTLELDLWKDLDIIVELLAVLQNNSSLSSLQIPPIRYGTFLITKLFYGVNVHFVAVSPSQLISLFTENGTLTEWTNAPETAKWFLMRNKVCKELNVGKKFRNSIPQGGWQQKQEKEGKEGKRRERERESERDRERE